MSSPTNGEAHPEPLHSEIGAVGSQEAVTVIAVGVTFGILCLMIGLMVASRFI